METCKKRGNKSILANSRPQGLCFKCSDEAIRAEAEIQTHSLQSLVASVMPDQSFSILGLAYWNNYAKTRVTDGFGKLIFSAIFSTIFLFMPEEHRMGILGLRAKKNSQQL
jgi:hypothetical protein